MPNPRLLVHVYDIIAGSALGASLSATSAIVVSRVGGTRAPYAIGSAGAAVVFFALARYLQTGTPDQAGAALKLQVVGVLVTLVALGWFFARMSGARLARAEKLALYGAAAALLVANGLSRWSLHYAWIGTPAGAPAQADNPLGLVTSAGVLTILYRGWTVVPLVIGVHRGTLMWRTGRRTQAMMAAAVCVMLLVSIVGGTIMDFDRAPRTYLATVPVFISMLALMGVASGVEQREQRHALLSVDAGLREANARLRSEIENREHLERRLVQTQKMEALGRMAAGVAHDFNNVLLVLRGQAELMLARERSLPEDRESIEAIEAVSERGVALTRQLLAFTRQESLAPMPLSPGRAIGDMLPLLSRMAGRDVELALHPAASGPVILADPTRFEQVIMNLVANARDAMAGAGRVTIVEEVMRDGATERCTCDGAVTGPHVRLTVADTGAGMDAETLSRVFEPFFTTKDEGCGTGLGLATVYGIVRQGGGQVTAASVPGQGSTFSICWPCTAGAETVAPSREAVPQSSVV